MERKEDTARRITRRKYEEKHKERRKEINGSFGTMMPRALCDEINEFLRVNNITKVKLIVEGYEALKQKMNSVTHFPFFACLRNKIQRRFDYEKHDERNSI